MKSKFICLILLILIFKTQGYSQKDTIVKKKEASFKIGAFYNNHLNYYGRTDSLQSSGVFPLAELWLNNKFYISAAPVFVINATQKMEYAGTVATAGYYTKSKNEKFMVHTWFTKPFYEPGSQLVQSALKAQVNTGLSWLNEYININAGGDIKLSDKLDYGLTAGLDHLFRHKFEKEWHLFVIPSAYLNAGTQHFASTYYKKSSFLFFPAIEQQVTEEVSKLNILSYEFSMPVVLTKNKLQIILNPAYVIPQNLIIVEGRPDLSESGKEMFYATVGAKITF
jgi:hypothetical protein